MIEQVLSWLTSAASWSGSDGIAMRIVEHLVYSGIVIAVTAALAIPVGLWVGHSGRAKWIIAACNSARAVPTLGLLFVVVLWVGPHLRGDIAYVLPSVIVLVLLAIPPVIAGAYAGVEAVDPAARDAAAGMGMRGHQVLFRVEIPCAMPLLLSGLRSAVLQVVATATIAAYVGLGGLGRYLIDGLALGDYVMTAGGSIIVALLALVLDLVIAGIQKVVISPGLTGKDPGRKSVGTTGTPSNAGRTSAPTVRTQS